MSIARIASLEERISSLVAAEQALKDQHAIAIADKDATLEVSQCEHVHVTSLMSPKNVRASLETESKACAVLDIRVQELTSLLQEKEESE